MGEERWKEGKHGEEKRKRRDEPAGGGLNCIKLKSEVIGREDTEIMSSSK